MSNNLDADRSITTGKMYPIDLAPQKITIVKSVSNTDMKMAHLISNQPKTTVSNQIMGHTSSGAGLMRPGLAQIISPNVASQPQMIVSGSPILQGTQIVSQGSQLLSQNSQIISQSQLMTPSGQIISPATQIISQGTQLSAPVSSSNNTVNIQGSVASPVSGSQVLNVAGQFVSGAGNLVVNSSVRTLPPTVRVLPPLPHHNATRPAVQVSGVNVSNTSGVLVSKSVGVTSHVPRGLAAGASLAVRPVAPTPNQPVCTQGSWSSNNRGPRGALVYGSRGVSRGGPTVSAPPVSQLIQSPVLTLPTTSVLSSTGVISTTVRGMAPRALTPTPVQTTPRPLPLLQRNYQPTKVVGVASVGVRGVVGNSAPAQLYYEVPRPAPSTVPVAARSPLTSHPALPSHPVVAHAHTIGPNTVTNMSVGNNSGNTALVHALAPQAHRPHSPYVHAHTHQTTPTQLSIVNAGTVLTETRPISTTPMLPRPSILRKRDIDGSPTKNLSTGLNASLGMTVGGGMSLSSGLNAALTGAVFVVGDGVTTTGRVCTGWEDVPTGGTCGADGSGSTTVSASSSPAPDDPSETLEPDPPPPPPPQLLQLQHDLSPRKKPRKQILSNEVRQCEYQPEDPPPSPPPVNIKAPKRSLLSSGYSCGWRSTALHFIRPSDVRPRAARPRDILAIATQKHVLTSADGWKVHHLTAQMDDLVSLETDVGDQLSTILRALDNASPHVLRSLQPLEHTILELLKGNIQRSKIVCESVQEAREDILRVFTHRKFVSDILTRQADKRCFRKHRSQS